MDAYTRHADLPNSGNETRTAVANCGDNRTAIFNPEVQNAMQWRRMVSGMGVNVLRGCLEHWN